MGLNDDGDLSANRFILTAEDVTAALLSRIVGMRVEITGPISREWPGVDRKPTRLTAAQSLRPNGVFIGVQHHAQFSESFDMNANFPRFLATRAKTRVVCLGDGVDFFLSHSRFLA